MNLIFHDIAFPKAESDKLPEFLKIDGNNAVKEKNSLAKNCFSPTPFSNQRELPDHLTIICHSTDESKVNDDPEKHTTPNGGRYGDLKKEGTESDSEVHHMPADSASDLERNDGPAIRMDKEDHRQTASCGNSKEAREYREKQQKLIEEGKFREALQMDIDDIHEKFGDKYDDAIDELLKYVDELEKGGKI